jgi:hypothetical protein
MQIECRPEQPSKADSPKVETREPHSNVTSRRAVQNLKQPSEIAVMDEGMHM